MRKPRRSEDLREYRMVEKKKRSEKMFRSLHIMENDLKVALIFPSSYANAISNLGFHRVFELLNGLQGIQCERFFYDNRFSRFYSLDTFRPLDEFHIWAFSCSFELDFKNVIHILQSQKIPLLNSERTDHHPLVLLGGAVTYFNADALWRYVDLIFHGDAEGKLQPLMNVLREGFRAKLDRTSILKNMSGIEHLSVPPLSIQATQISKTLDVIDTPAVSIFTSQQSVFPGKVLFEIGRGCLRTCKFCVAGHTRGPARFVKPDIIQGVLDEMIEKGFTDCGLISATFTDHPNKDEILDLLEARRMHFSVSSLRLDSLSEKLINGLMRSGQKEITIAPEGGSQKIRDVMNKQITGEDIEKSLKIISQKGMKRLKMYFIYGLEEEDETDLAAIGQITERAKFYGFTDIKISLNPLIPKPGTPFAMRKIEDIKILRAKKRLIEGILDKNVQVKFESIRNSIEQYQIANAAKTFRFTKEEK